MTDHMLKDELKKEGISTEGTHDELVQRLGAIHKSCKYDGRPVTLPPIPNEKIDKMVYIKLTSDCMRIDLCADLAIPQLGFTKTVSMFVDTKPCSLKLIIGFEECEIVFSLLGYEWGKPKIYRLNDHVGVRYKVGLDEFQENFRMSIGLLIDIGEETPLLDAMFFNDVELPIPKCNGRTHLAECTTAKAKYTPSVPLPAEYKSTPCQLTCGGVHCCVNYTFDVVLFRTPPVVNLPVFLNFDPCELSVEIGYGKYKHTEKLLAYNWGTEAVLDVGKGNSTPVSLKYKISKADKDFKIDFNVSTCLTIDFDTYCYPKDGLILMDQQTISGCDHKVTLQKNKFKMSEWLTSLGLDPNLPKLPRTTADLLLKKFPINDKLLPTRCDQTRPPYTPQVDGWRNECPRSTRKLTKLPEGVRCHLAASCTRIECCFKVAYLDMSFCTNLNVDVCQQNIKAAIEKTSVSFNLIKEKASLSKGVSKSLDIAKVFKMSFDVKKDGAIIKADYDIKVCFEEDKCLYEANILSATELPPPTCTAMDTSKLSLTEWAGKRGIDLSGGLQPAEADLLLEQLSIKDKMLDPSCDRNGLKYKPAGPNQWKNDCAKPEYSSSLSKLSLPVNCHLDTDCKAVECCLESKTLGKTIQVSFNIDMCNHYIEGSIEQFMFKVNMPDYRWGERKEMTFNGVHIAKMKFRIERLQSQDVFAVDLTASMCFEKDSCEMDALILDKAFLPIPSCPTKQGYHDKEFSVKQWVADKGGTMNAQLSADILNELDITRFLQTGQCQSYSQPFKGAKDGWKKDCPRSVPLNSLPQTATCHLSDTCTGVSCCLEASEVKRNFKIFLTIDACSNSMEVGIEKLMFSYSLFDYDWGKTEVIDLHGLIKVEFSVKKHWDQKAFIADLKLMVCPVARQPCPTTIPVLQNTLLTSQPCTFQLISAPPGFQMSDYVSSMTALLDAKDEKRLLAGLGVAQHMKTESCSFLGRGSNGWSSSCEKSVTLDSLPDSTACEMSSSCMKVDCCLDLPILEKNINYKLDLDVCKSTLNLEIENVKFQKVLFKYHWGSPDRMHLKGVFRADFIIDYFNTQKEVALTLNISACFEPDKPCQFIVPVARHTKIPVPDCNTATPLQDFSLSKWKRENNIGSSMTPVQRSRLEMAMDITKYVLDPMCNRTKGKFKPQSQGWNNACARDIALNSLPDGVSCHIPEHCTAVECCVTSAKLERTFNVKVNVDHNNQVLIVGIEKLVHQRSLHTYKWGTEENFSLNGVAKMKFRIQDLKRSRKYLITFGVSVCTEAGQPCDKEIEVMTDVLLPRLTRDWYSKDTVPGFTFKKWRQDFNVPAGEKLTDFQQKKLLNDLDLLDHLDETSCDVTAAPYDEATDGWNNECSGDVEVGKLPTGIACHLNSNCHSLQCCVKDDTLGRSFNVKIDIEACASKISMTIEKLVFVRSFSTYSWGRVEHFNLKDVIRADVLIDDLRGQDKFLLVANMSVCLEKDSCLISANVLKKALFSKDPCELDSLETLKEFSLDTFLSDNGATGKAKLSPLAVTRLFEALDLARFLKAPQCDTKAAPYTGGTAGWKKDCSPLKKVDGFSAVPANAACHLAPSCTSINCCVFIDLLSRNFNFALSVDACNYKMTIALEKHEYHQMLMDYQWDTEEHFYLKGVLRMDYKLTKQPQERAIEATVTISVCLKESECLFSHKVLDKAKLPQASCEWSSKVNSRNFSLEKWVEARGMPSAQTELSDSLVAQLLEDLGMSSYLPVQNSLDIMLDIDSPYCKRDESPFSPHNVHNWNKDCTSVDVPSLDKSTNCYLSSNCMSVECCTDIPHIRRSLKSLFALDICTLTVEMKLERLTFNLSLLEYEWGTTAHFSIGSFIILEYKMDNNPTAHKITVNLRMKVCFEKQCEKDFPIMSNSEITYSPCGPDQTIPLQGLSLDFYKPEVCKFGLDLNTCSMKLPSNLEGTCLVTDSCMGVRCCVPFDVQHLGVYSISTGIEADHCTDKFEYHVENKKWTKHLTAMTFDKNVTEQVGDGLTLSYIVKKSVAMIELSFSLKVCVKDSPGAPEVCQYRRILDKVIFQTSSCGFLGRKKRSYMSDMVKKNMDVDSILSNLMKKSSITNDLIKKALDAVKDFPDVNDLKYEIGDRKESAENPETALNLMGTENPKTIIYSGKALGGSFNVGVVGGGGKVIKMLGKAVGVLARGQQAYTIGSGLTQAGMELLGAKLANMSIGELLALSEELTISPDTAVKISMELRDLAMAVYTEVIQTVINTDFTDFFKSFDVILEGKFEIPRQNFNFFSHKWFFLVGGIVPMTFDFGIGASFGIKFAVGAQVLALKAKGQVTPYVGAHAWGELGVGFVLYGKLRLEGYLLTLAFPTVAEIQFSKWPLSVRVIMDLEFVPIELSLYGIVTLEVDIKIAKITKVLFQAKIFGYTCPVISTRIFDLGTHKEDDTPPHFLHYIQHKSDRRRRARGKTESCFVRQVPGKDYTEPTVEVAAAGVEDRGIVDLYLEAGTQPGLDDVIAKVKLGGPSLVITHELKPHGVPLYFTILGVNHGDLETPITCSIPTYDITPPGGRLTADFLTTSNPSELRASLVVYEDSVLNITNIGVGVGKGMYADEIVPFSNIDLRSGETKHYDPSSDETGEIALTHFNGVKSGRLIGPVISTTTGLQHAGLCARLCLLFPPTKCLSMNFDYSSSGTCELLEAIEGHHFEVAVSGQFVHFERLGVGLAHEFVYNDLSLRHNTMYYFSMHLVNTLNFSSFIHSRGVLVDITPPEPGPLADIQMDTIEVLECPSLLPEDRPDWAERCKGVNSEIKNHRLIMDGPGSMTLFNGEEPLTDLKYTRANNYVAANWDGITDVESGILGYSWSVGTQPCEDLLHPHRDPHKHLFDEAEWTHTGLLSPLPEEFNPLPDGKYYVTLRTFNKVEYGGPLVTTVCHTTPFCIDNTPPIVYEVYNIAYEEENHTISAEYNVSDPESGVREIDLCLGQSTRDCYHMPWHRSTQGDGRVNYQYEIPGGKPVWIKVRAINNVDLKTVDVADHPIIIDNTPPVAGVVYDGDVNKLDLNYTMNTDKVCANWFDFHDPESGIAYYDIVVLDNTDTPITEVVSVDHKTSKTCITLHPERLLQHLDNVHVHITAFNAGHRQQNISAKSNGVIVDMTPPIQGDIVDGRSPSFRDQKFSTQKATIGAEWRAFSDPESSLREYSVQILRAKDMSSEFEVLKDWKTLNTNISQFEWHNFNLGHRDVVKTKLRTTNKALASVEQTTDGFVVDLTPPRMTFIGDGSVTNVDAEFQESDDKVEAVFNFFDNESGLEHFKYQVYELHQGSRHQIYPPSGGWETIHDWHATSLKQHGLSLTAGAMYSVRVGAVNRAGAVSTYDTNGVLLDNTKPVMHWVYVGIFAGSVEEFIDGYVIQSDPTGIKATWFGEDTESDIAGYHVAVGTTKERTDILDWTDVGPDKDKYISGLTLDITDPVTMTPVYYVKVMARNGAGIDSAIMTSHPIRVVDQDKAGIVIDGGDATERENYVGIGEDIDYQTDSGVVTVQFAGFESHEHGVMYYDWAVGTTPGGEEVQPFIMAGLSHDESESDVPGHGLASRGFGQAVLPLKSGVKYYTTVRGITNGGNILESTSDGFIVDQTPPTVQLESFALEENQTRLLPGIVLYQSEVDSLSASWKVQDTDCPIKKVYFSVGSYPYAADIYNVTEIQSITGVATLPPGIKPTADGRPNILTITAVNEVGLSTRIISPTLIVDVTPPTEGEVKCPSFTQPLATEECTWSGFHDDESAIVSYEFSLGSGEGLEDVTPPVSLPAQTNKFLIQGLSGNVSHGQSYYAIVKAINSVGKKASVVSKPISVDTTPPTPGTVVELKSDYRVNVSDPVASENLNVMECDNKEECLQIKATCQESMTGVGVAWEAFRDEQTAIVKYEIAVGTTPGGGELKSLFEVDNVEQRYTYVTGLMLKGHRKVYVTVKGTNGAGLSTIATSPGIYLSYLSQDLEPLTHVGVMDGNSQNGDLDYQTSMTSMSAQWDVSGDPCPVVKYEWAIHRADGLVVQDFVDTEGRTFGVNDQLTMKNKQRFYQHLRVTNALGFTYTLRSNGITVRDDPLVPGHVNDGDVIGFDLQFVRTTTKVSANWDMFGSDGNTGKDPLVLETGVSYGAVPTMDRSHASNQEVVFYEVALGTDRRFDKTRDNVVPFTDVGRNKSVTFYDLELVTLDALYYFTVRAHSASGSTVEVTSNGFAVGFNDSATAGLVKMGDYISTTDHVELRWEEFKSDVGIMMYYAGLADTDKAEQYHCGEFTEMGVITKEERQSVMNIADVHNVGRDTFVTFSNLTLLHDTSYYVWIIGVNKAGVCNMTSHRFTVDASPPTEGKIRAGPYYDLASSYAAKPTQLTIHWKDFNDGESGIKSYRVALLKNISCGQDSSEELVVEALTLETNTTSYTFMDLNLQRSAPYFVRFTVDNNAGLSTTVDSAPVLYDDSLPSPGHVVDGNDFTTDVSWMGSASEVKGTFLHHPIPDSSGCPGRHVKFDDREWKFFASDSNFVGEGKSLSLTFRRENVHPKPDEVEIKLARDTKKPRMFSGGYYRNADLMNGGVYKMSIKAAGGDSRPVTSVVFWDGPEDYILNNDFTPTPSWADSNCACCKEEPVPEICKCNCEEYMTAKDYYRRHQKSEATATNTTSTTTTTTTTPTTTLDEISFCFLYQGEDESVKGRLVAWCMFKDPMMKPLETVRDLDVDPSLDYHDYTISFTISREEAKDSAATWCMKVEMDGEYISDQCGIPHLSTNTSIFLGIWNHKNYMPATRRDGSDYLRVWEQRATFKNMELPPELGTLCRYGNPFRGGNNAIVRYEAGIGTKSGQDDVVPLRPIHSPCVPCLRPCDTYSCNATCDQSRTEQVRFSLNDLSLNETATVNGKTEPIPYYLTVKAVLGSGLSAVSSSDGFSIDTTPPDFDHDLMLYMDVYQGNFTPSSFQGSNDTIKAVWKCSDNESEIVNYEWAIGRIPGSDELQTFTSTGEYPGGENAGFAGILRHNITYYVTVRCTNGGGLSTTYKDKKGVTVLLEDPVVDDVNTTIDGAEPFADDVIPDNAMKTDDQNSVGASWTISMDPSIKRYDFCVGSSTSVPDDIFPCTWVGYNQSGTVTIEDGYLKINGEKVQKLNQYRPDASDWINNPFDKTRFTMAPGTEMFIFMKMCNEAGRCTAKLIGSSFVETKSTHLAVTGPNGLPISIQMDGTISLRRKRAASKVSVETPAGLKPGQSVAVTTLSGEDLEKDYRSDASTEFVPYITDPATTATDPAFIDRVLRKRINYSHSDISFAITSIGDLAMSGPLIVTFPYEKDDMERKYKLLHWNPDTQTWHDSSQTCSSELDTEVEDLEASVIKVKVCGTRGGNQATRRRRSASTATDFSQPTQFLITPVLIQIPNDRPMITGHSLFEIDEDAGKLEFGPFEVISSIGRGTMMYMLEAADADGDEVRFKINQDDIRVDNLTLSENGLLIYTPAPDFSGVVEVPVVLYEVPVDGVPPSEVIVNVTIIVVSVADAPTAFAASDNVNILNPDHTEPILTFIEQERVNDTSPTVYTWEFGAYDVDGDNMTMFVTQPEHGYLTVGDVVNTSPDCAESHASDFPCSVVTVGQRADSVSWIYKIFRYEPDTEFYGFDEIRLYVQDQTGLYSDIITLKFVIMERPCQNEAKCKSKNPDLYTCTDYRRAESFHQYYICDCAPGWTNTICDTDIDECSDSPCVWPYVCHDAIGRYDCACPESDPNCDGLEAWMIGLVVLTLLLLVVISFLGWYSFMVKRGRLKWSTLWRRIAGEAPDVSETKTAFVKSASEEVDDGSENMSKSDTSLPIKKHAIGSKKNKVSATVGDSAPLKYSVEGNSSRPTTPREVKVQPLSNHASPLELPRPSMSNAVEWTRSMTPVERSMTPVERSMTPVERSMTPVEQCDERPGSGYSMRRSILQKREGSIVLTENPIRESDL
ncbi:uncharacterized protein [Haliotis asinina]|uniref:uncharacterized protein n=1 Tax=Haliotis asinina TaxID=109174 RepID=UPI0035325360